MSEFFKLMSVPTSPGIPREIPSDEPMPTPFDWNYNPNDRDKKKTPNNGFQIEMPGRQDRLPNRPVRADNEIGPNIFFREAVALLEIINGQSPEERCDKLKPASLSELPN